MFRTFALPLFSQHALRTYPTKFREPIAIASWATSCASTTRIGDPWMFGIQDCVVYKARIEHQDIVDWNVVLASDWGGSYPKWYTVCSRASISYDGKYVEAFQRAQAIGAGGGCADGGDYRSRTDDAQG
jgi:hypothetical protein